MMVQGSDEWLQARCGKVTASRISDVVAKTKSGYGSSRANYMAELIAERMTGRPAGSFTNAAMQWGTETEPMAREQYEMHEFVDVEQVGLIDHPQIEMSGASPDGLVGDDGLVEIKCPNTATHIDTLLGQSISDKYIKQMQWQMACTDRKWCDFVSYDPRMPDRHALFVKRVERDQEMIDNLEHEVEKFLSEVSEKIKRLESL